MINWLKKNKDVINLTGIEVRLEIPLTTLSQVIREKNPIDLPKKWVEPLRELGMEMSIVKISYLKSHPGFSLKDEPFVQMAKKLEDFEIPKDKSKLDIKKMVAEQKTKKDGKKKSKKTD